MTFVMLLVVGVSIPANLFGTPASASAASRVAGSSVSTQALGVTGTQAQADAARDEFSVTLPIVEKVQQVFSSSGEPSISGVSFIPAPGPVRWATDTSPAIGHGVTNSHHGQDLLISQGTPVHAIADGVVMVSGIEGSYGQYVVIQSVVSGHIVTSLYAHMGIGSQKVSAGQTVTMGQVIGAVGSSGSATGYLLYLRILQDGALCDTITYIKGNPAGGAAPHSR